MSSRFFVDFPQFQVFPGIFVHQSLLFAKAFLFVLTAALDNLIAKLKGESAPLHSIELRRARFSIVCFIKVRSIHPICQWPATRSLYGEAWWRRRESNLRLIK
jgi:hypothetical protein